MSVGKQGKRSVPEYGLKHKRGGEGGGFMGLPLLLEKMGGGGGGGGEGGWGAYRFKDDQEYNGPAPRGKQNK